MKLGGSRTRRELKEREIYIGNANYDQKQKAKINKQTFKNA